MQRHAPDAITTDQLKERLAQGERVKILDVREPEEYEGWHIPGAQNVPVDQVVEGVNGQGDGPIVTICAHGPRSKKAAEALRARGVQANHVEGGMVAWNSTYQRAAIKAREGARVLQIKRLGKACLSYLVVSGEEALVVDPSIDTEEYLTAARETGAEIRLVVDTHAHADHVSGARLLADATGAAYWAPAELGERIPHKTLAEGTKLRVGDVEIRVLETPGHTPGSVTLLLGDIAFTGDTLFAESVGRPDLGQDPRPNAATLYDSLHERLLTLPKETRVLPAHAGGLLDPAEKDAIIATLEDLAKKEAPLKMPKADFIEWVAEHAGPKPENFSTIKNINLGKETMPDAEDVHELEAGPNRCAVG